MSGSDLSSVTDRLLHIGHSADRDIDLIEGALTLAQWADPQLDLAPYRRHVQTLVVDARSYLSHDVPTCTLVAETVRQIVFRRFGYAGVLQPGEPGEQGDGANLARVIDKRRGGAMALAILYHRVLERLGVNVEILDFAPRPLVRIQDGNGQRMVLDPMDGARSIDARGLLALYRTHRGGEGALDPFHLSALTKRAVLVALQDQIKVHHLRYAAPEASLAALEAALMIDPQNARLWREAGLLHARLDHIGDAIEALKRFLQLPGGDAHRYTASQLLQQLQNREDKDPT